MSELKPCPFCGSKAIIKIASWTGVPYVMCSNNKCVCQPNTYGKFCEGTYAECKTPEQAKKLSIEIWNTRSEDE
jgi:formate dehydrogenase maturation protein FdhE